MSRLWAELGAHGLEPERYAAAVSVKVPCLKHCVADRGQSTCLGRPVALSSSGAANVSPVGPHLALPTPSHNVFTHAQLAAAHQAARLQLQQLAWPFPLLPSTVRDEFWYSSALIFLLHALRVQELVGPDIDLQALPPDALPHL